MLYSFLSYQTHTHTHTHALSHTYISPRSTVCRCGCVSNVARPLFDVVVRVSLAVSQHSSSARMQPFCCATARSANVRAREQLMQDSIHYIYTYRLRAIEIEHHTHRQREREPNNKSRITLWKISFRPCFSLWHSLSLTLHVLLARFVFRYFHCFRLVSFFSLALFWRIYALQ